MISICLCDPQPIIHEGLRSLLEGSEEFEFRASCEALEDAAALATAHQPSVLVIDRSFGMHPLLESLALVHSQLPDLKLIVWAANMSDVECFRALQAGARGIMKKSISSKALCHCLRTVSNGEIWTENLYLLDETPLERPRNRPLTPREQEVAALVSKGMKNREIAEALGIATGTVKIHLMHIFEKTGIRDRFELALQGLRLKAGQATRSEGKSEPVWPNTIRRTA